MKLCERGLNFVQIYNDTGDVRICSWTKDGYVGSLLNHTFEELFHSETADQLRNRLACGDYCDCNVDDCPWLACGEIENHQVEINSVPKSPNSLFLAYENVCNYNCSTCNIHERWLKADKVELEKRYDIIESRIRSVLPHVKHISANGQGEVFVSKRILKLLSEWKPLAPVNECSASLETNGSLFDEIHWKQIENLGKYHLRVAVTVMSFNEYTYQQLSGTKLPISQVENNLRFIKSLREQGIVNEFEIATVVQERNFREMPGFARRCVEEFGADSVRLRSFVPWGKKPLEEEWFTDVINPYHPYHKEYEEVMKDPIFQNPKVHDWSGGIGTHLGEHPYKKKLNYANKKIQVQQKYIVNQEDFMRDISNKTPVGSDIIIYGIGEIGKVLVQALKDQYNIVAIIDNNCCSKTYNNIPIVSKNDIASLNKDACVIITPLGDYSEIRKELINGGYPKEKVYTVEESINIE